MSCLRFTAQDLPQFRSLTELPLELVGQQSTLTARPGRGLHVTDVHQEQHFACAEIGGEVVTGDLVNLLGIRAGTDEDDAQ
ncbi:hypothetical protein AB4Y72_15150 [Arthrobacter sp. YAF34]|uniref:hypothetical protein n=1 Tax=Arthrobacter sp. YAF34 TaxID=3233083 RepID=UPI003F8F672B